MSRVLLVTVAIVLMASSAFAVESRAKQNYKCVSEVNEQINIELNAAQVYLSLSSYFGHDSVALHGFSKMFEKSWKEETEHAQKFIDYQIKRGGKVIVPNVQAPQNDSKWQDMSVCQILEIVLGLEMKVHDHLLGLHSCAEKPLDPHLQDYIESEFLTEQINANKELADLIRRLELATTVTNADGKSFVSCNGLGLHLIDKDLS